MLPVVITDSVGKVSFFLIFMIVSIYIFYRKNDIKPRYFYLLIGTIYLTLSSQKGLSYLIIGGILPLAYYLKPAFKKDTVKEKKKSYSYLLSSSCLVVISLLVVIGTDSMTFTYKFKEGIDYLLENNKASDITLYTGYAEGAYPEWKGIKCYIDPRAEIFLKGNNKQKDIMEEYYLLQIGNLDVNEFLEKYKFDYLLVIETDYLYNNMDDIENYKLVYENVSIDEFSIESLNNKIKYRIYQRIS